MRVQSVVPWLAVVGTLASWSPPAAVSQELTLTGRAPRFFYASSAAAKAVEIDVSHNALLDQVVSLHLDHATIGGLLAEIQRQTGIIFGYDRDVPTTRPVTLEAESITVAASLGAILVGTGVDVMLMPTGHVWLTESISRTLRIQEGSIVGRATDKQTGDPIIGATVILEPAHQSATTGTDGRYGFAHLSPGDYTVRARYIGYESVVASATVSAGQEVTIDLPLQKSAQPLEQLVVTGTIIPTEAKALPTPITVISADEIAQQHPQALVDVFRQATPTAAAFRSPSQPLQTSFSVRGVSSLSPDSPMKIFIDGVEASTFALDPVDPSSIERIEIIRGPQAATLYGADAAGGVIQIFTKRGDSTLTRPQVHAQTELGVVQTPYSGFGGVLRQEYTGSVRGGQDVSYNFGASYTHLADYLPTGERSSQLSPSVYGGTRIARGIVTADLSARYYRNKLPLVSNPLLLTTGEVSSSRPDFQISDFTNDTYGARLTISPTSWWQNRVTLGVDRSSNESVQYQHRLTTPADTLNVILSSGSRKISVGYNTSVSANLGVDLAGSLTAGIDHYDQDASSSFTARALNTEGTIKTLPAGQIAESRSNVTNTGYFIQTQLDVRSTIFITGGLRAEANSTFGPNLGTPVLPRAGLSFVHGVGNGIVKVRGSYGEGIRTPSFGQAFGAVQATEIKLANPLLGPERQRGWDAGVDLVFGNRGSLSLTGYEQIAEDLIAFVQLPSDSLPTFQFQNIGRVANRGVEIEGTLTYGSLQVRAQYGYVHSRIEDLGPSVSPGAALQVGDEPPRTPAHTAGAALTFAAGHGTTVAAGITYVGKYRYTDFLALLRCFGGTGPCQPTAHGYIVNYPGFAKINATFSQQITRQIGGFIAIDNLTNNQAYEGSNSAPVIGRTTMAGLRANF
jgi:outer membrane receptor protein involved in Fe transport